MTKHVLKTKRFKQQHGFSLTESLIAATVLLGVTNMSATFFTKSSQQLQQASLRDSVHAAIEQDLEQNRRSMALWKSNHHTGSGQISYAPPEAACNSRTLASALLNDSEANLQSSYDIDLSNLKIPTQGLQIKAELAANPTNGNLLQVNYSSNATGPLAINKQAQLLPPAQGWCP